MTRTLLLVRHASSSGPAAEAPLSPQGEAEARALVDVLSQIGPSDLFSSPYLRAVDTLSPFAQATGLAAQIVDDLRERTLSSLDLPDWKDHIARSFDDPHYAPPGGESLDVLHARALRAIGAILSLAQGPLPAAATHGGWISAVLHRIDPGFGFAGWQSLTNPDLILLTLDGGRPVAYGRLPKG